MSTALNLLLISFWPSDASQHAAGNFNGVTQTFDGPENLGFISRSLDALEEGFVYPNEARFKISESMGWARGTT